MTDDPSHHDLGKLLVRHRVSLAGVLLTCGFVGLIGMGLVGYALTRDPISLIFLLVGTAALLLAFVLLAMNAFNVGRSLELRKRGIRFVNFGKVTEFWWDEIATIEVNRTDRTNLGVATLRTRSADASSPSGPLTNTEWAVSIVAHDGRTMRLPPMFLRTVRDPKRLISQLRMRAGLP